MACCVSGQVVKVVGSGCGVPTAANGRGPSGVVAVAAVGSPHPTTPLLIGVVTSQSSPPRLGRPELAGLDFYVASGRREVCGAVRGFVSQWFGQPTRGRGRHLYADRWRWANGAELWFTEEPDGTNADHCCLSIPGGALAEWSAEERLDRTWELFVLGLHRVRRADLPVDFRGDGLTLLDDVYAAVGRRELCGLRMASRVQPTRAGVKGVRRVVGDTVYLGKRGNGGFSVCAYDKGLEQSQGRGRPGQWVRWEPRFEDDAAQAVMGHLWAARRWELEHKPQQLDIVFKGVGATEPGSDVVRRSWREEYVSLAFGCVDFRERATGKSRLLCRRRRAAWWVAVLAGIVPVRLRVGRRRFPSLSRHEVWLQRCFFPTLRAMADLTGQPMQEVLVNLGVDRGRVKRGSQVAYEYASRCVTRRIVA